MRQANAAAWGALAWSLKGGVRVLRGSAGPESAEEWRKVRFSYSQFAEDLVAHDWFSRHTTVERGTYVDVGAFHPVQWTNTLLFHKLGWRGVNIDASPAAIELFRSHRPGDANVVSAVSDHEGEMTYAEYPQDATNRLLAKGEPLTSVLGESPLRTTVVRVRTLTSILDEHLPRGGSVDFLTIDCEGADIAVLRGLDFARHAPRMIAIEAHDDAALRAIEDLLRPHGYKAASRVELTSMFVR